MEARATGKYVRISPQKVRLVIDMIRGKATAEAKRILDQTPKKASGLIKKVLMSALANATQNPNIDEKVLFVKKAYADQGPTLKRWRARAQGRAAGIKKRTSHISIVLDEK
ncbi:MAG: 50S ribosomal protein L22 [Deltaproteobacteria bacterium]|nr:50S ribosomal protein L22 [Deltaproteobacteria bacterium]